MSHINMVGMNMNGGNGVMPGIPGMPMMNNGMNGATPRPGSEQDESDYEARLNAYIYDYFLRNENWESARSLINSGVQMQPPPSRDGDVNGTDENAMQTDSKEDIDSKRPDDLPPSKVHSIGQGSSFLLDWFGLFWDVYWAQHRGANKASHQAAQYVQHSQAQTKMRADQQQAYLHNGIRQMVPNGNMDPQQLLQMRQMYGMNMNSDLRKNAMNNRNQFQPSSAQMAHIKQQQLLQQQMRRDPSDMDVNGQRPHTPSSGDNAPSPSKRPRLENAPFNGQMLPNGRGGPLQGMPGQQMMDMNMQANQRLMRNGINPQELSQAQLASYQAQNPQIQEKSIQVYAQNLAKTQMGTMPRQGMGGQESPMMQPGFEMGAPNVDLYNQQMMRNGVPGPNGPNGGNHALQDYQMQLMLLEQQNKKRLLMARQEQDNVVRDGPMPGGPGGFAPGMSPSGSRSGPSPDPNQMKQRGGTPKMGATGLPTSPMPDGNMPQRSSPAAMGFTGPMGPDMYQNGMAVPPNGMRMPSSHPGQFGAGPFNNQQAAQMEAMRAAQGRLPNGTNWQQGPQGQAPMMQPAQPQQPQPMDTPQQRNAMPPPPAVQPGAATNGRPSPPAQPAPPTPQPGNKAPPKGGKKEKQEPRKRPTKKNSNASVAPTPAGEAEAPPTPTPATPTIPRHPDSFNAAQKGEAPAPPSAPPLPAAAAPAQGNLPPPPDTTAMTQFGLEGMDNGQYNMAFGSLENQDVLDNFDFDSFLQSNDEFEGFDPTLTFNNPEGVEPGVTDVV